MSIRRAEIEGLIVGQCIVEGSATTLRAMEIIDEADFEEPSSSVLFRVCTSLVLRGCVVDLVQVDDFMKANGSSLGTRFKTLSTFAEPQKVVTALLLKAADLSVNYWNLSYSCNLQSNCNFLRKESNRSKAVEVIERVRRQILEEAEVQEVLDQSIQDLLSLSARIQKIRSYTSLEDASNEAIEETERELAGGVVRLSTGFAGLDQVIYGLEKGRLYVIAAEEKVGKSLSVNQIALHSVKKGHSTGIISLEMRSSEIVKRLAGVHNGQDAVNRLDTLERFREENRHLPLFIRDGSANQSAVLTTAWKLYAEKRIELLIVDYLQLVELYGKDRVNEINEFVGKLKGLAMDLEIPVILIAAVLNKRIDGRTDRKPCPADIRDTGRLANDADCMMFLWKPDEEDENYIELFVSRSRYSRYGRIGLCLDADTLKLSEVTLRDAGEVPLKRWKSGGG